jgi:hypothetical protein
MHSRTLPAIIFAAAALLVSSHAPAARVATRRASAPRAQEESGELFVGVLRADGLVVPFVAYWQGYWLTPWTKPAGSADDENSIADLTSAWFADEGDFPPVWYARTRAGRAPVRLRASRLVKSDNHCSTNWALQTDLPGARKPGARHRENVGVAASAPHESDAPARLDPRARDLAPLVALVRRSFDEEERATLAGRPRDATREGGPQGDARKESFPPEAERRKRAPAVVKLYRHTASGGRRLYYFEAERRYPKPAGANDRACENVSVLGGWLLQAGRAAPRLVEQHMTLTDCDAKEAASGRPLGLIRLRGREFLIQEEHGYESESYVLLELRGAELRRLRLIFGGGC